MLMQMPWIKDRKKRQRAYKKHMQALERAEQEQHDFNIESSSLKSAAQNFSDMKYRMPGAAFSNTR